MKSDNASRSENDPEISIVHAGGTLYGKTIIIPDIPDLAVGKRYFVFVKDDGAFHANPFPGGCKAVIEIYRDSRSGGESLAPVSACRSMTLVP